MADQELAKVWFELDKDADGYPPDRWETLWAAEVEDGLFCVDNIPFFVRGISNGDVISVEIHEGQRCFKSLIRPSASSVVRVFVSVVDDVQAARESFRNLGCESEGSHIPKLFSLVVPGNVSFTLVEKLLKEGEATGRWEYEEGTIRHKTTTG